MTGHLQEKRLEKVNILDLHAGIDWAGQIAGGSLKKRRALTLTTAKRNLCEKKVDQVLETGGHGMTMLLLLISENIVWEMEHDRDDGGFRRKKSSFWMERQRDSNRRRGRKSCRLRWGMHVILCLPQA